MKYITGIALDPRITGQSQALPDESRERHERSRGKQRLFGEIACQADTWQRPHRVPVKTEHPVGGASPHHAATSPEGDQQDLHDKVYCAGARWRTGSGHPCTLIPDHATA